MIMILKGYGAAILGIGFLYFIAIRLFDNVNSKKKALFTSIFGFIIFGLFLGAIIYDSINITTLPKFSFASEVYCYVIVSALYFIIVPSIYLAIGCSRHERFKTYQYKIKKEKEKVVPTVKDVKEHIYYVIKHNGNFLLKESIIGGEKFYSGIQEKLDNKILFHDEKIKNIIEELELNKYDSHNVNTYQLVGEVTVKGKKDEHYYCYVIDINSKNQNLNELYEVSPYDLIKYNMNALNKQILFHIILRDYFKIEL